MFLGGQEYTASSLTQFPSLSGNQPKTLGGPYLELLPYLYFNRLFIGDPRGNSTDTSYEGVKEPGVIWKCSLATPAGNILPQCHILNLDPIDGKVFTLE